MSLRKLFHKIITIPVFKAIRTLTRPTHSLPPVLIHPRFDTLPPVHKLTYLVSSFTLLYTLGLGLLSWAWYRQQRRSTFHFFDDNAEWQQMDKFGHFFTSFHLSKGAYEALKAVEQPEEYALKYGGWAGGCLMTPIEILDGFSEGYGASWGDELANFAGSAFFIWQQTQLGGIYIQPRFQFSPTHYAALRPSLLGKDWSEQWLKDYNGQTYWFTIIPTPTQIQQLHPLLALLSKYFVLGIGYSAKNMIYARDAQNLAAGFVPYRELQIGILWKNSILPTTTPLLKLLNGIFSLWAAPLWTWKVSTKSSDADCL